MSEKQMRLGALEAGGTKMVCAVVSGDGEVLDRMETPTLTPAETVPQMIEWFTARDVDALGIGAFGPTCVNPNDERYGSILQTPKLAWRGHGLRAAFADALGIPVAYDTDASARATRAVSRGSPPAPPSPRAGESPRPSSRTTMRCGRSRGIIWGRCARTSCSCTRLAASSSAAA